MAMRCRHRATPEREVIEGSGGVPRERSTVRLGESASRSSSQGSASRRPSRTSPRPTGWSTRLKLAHRPAAEIPMDRLPLAVSAVRRERKGQRLELRDKLARPRGEPVDLRDDVAGRLRLERRGPSAGPGVAGRLLRSMRSGPSSAAPDRSAALLHVVHLSSERTLDRCAKTPRCREAAPQSPGACSSCVAQA